jgi:uncharacterized membrane protein YhhN
VAAGLSEVRRRAAWVCVAAYAALSVVDVVGEARAIPVLVFALPLILMPLLAAFTLLTVRRSQIRSLLLLALIFAWLGDCLGFSVLLKIIFFLGTQIAYCVAFWPMRSRSLLARRGPLIGYALLMTAVVIFVATQSQALALPVIIYGLLLSLMVALASGVGRLAAAGAVLFLISDLILGYDFFLSTTDSPLLGALVMGTYLPAQLLIVLGVVRHAATEQPPEGAASAVS